MAQTKRKRRTKHRGNAAGAIESRGRTGRKPTPEERKTKPRQSAERVHPAALHPDGLLHGPVPLPPSPGQEAGEAEAVMDIRMFTVGPVAENCFLFRQDGAKEAVIVDPGEEAPKLLGAIEELGLELQAILLTHTHFDHVGAVAPVAHATGAPVYCPKLEVPVLQD